MSPIFRHLKALALLFLMLTAMSLQVSYSGNLTQQIAQITTPSNSAAVTSFQDTVPFAKANAAFVMQPSAANAWGGARTGRESTLADRVVDYHIDATLDPVKHTVDGQEKLTWRNRSNQPIRAIYLHLYLNAFEGFYSTFYEEKLKRGFDFRSDVSAKNGEWGHIELGKITQAGAPVPWTFVQPDGGPKTDHTVVRFDLPTPVPAGGSTTLDIAFHDQLPRVVARTGYFGTFHLVGQWFPKIGVLELAGERGATAPRWNVHEFHLHSEFYADYGNYDVNLTVPKDYSVGATGQEQGEPHEVNGKVTHHFVQGDVHDFAWVADNRLAKPLDGQYIGLDGKPVKVRVLYTPENVASAAPTLKATIDSLAYFSTTLGAYPYQTVTAVVPPFNAAEAGGMEYPTFFTTDGYNRIKPNSVDEVMLAFVTIHEFGHGYFYGILGSNEFEELMLDEGLNEYWDNRMLRSYDKSVHWAPRIWQRLGIDPVIHPAEFFQFERLTALNKDPTDPTGANSWDRFSTPSYVSVYNRTAILMRDLEERLGHDVIERAFKQYYATWKFRHPSIADLQATLSEVSGKPDIVAKAFAQQVYSAQKMDDRIDQFTSVEFLPQQQTAQGQVLRADGYHEWAEVTREQIDKQIEDARKQYKKQHPNAQEGMGPYPYLTTVILRRTGVAVPQTLVVKFADGTSEKVLWNDEQRWARFTWVKPAQAVSAQIDEQEQHYLDMNKLDDSRTIKADSSASRRWTAELATFFQSLITLIATL